MFNSVEATLRKKCQNNIQVTFYKRIGLFQLAYMDVKCE